MRTLSRDRIGRAIRFRWEPLEGRCLLSSSFDITSLTALRSNPAFSQITGQGVGIAVLDTGVDARNPELTPNVVAFYNAVENPVASGSVAVSGATDKDGHGTHVSGIAASSNKNIGVAYGAKLVDIKVLPDAFEAQLGGDPVLRGLEWVAANYQTYNIKVVSMSLGEPGVNDNTVTVSDARDAEAVQIKALEKLGITVVSASGNSYANDPTAGESFPAVVSTIGVANTWSDPGRASDFNVPFGEGGDQFYAIDHSAKADTLASTSQRSTVVRPGTNVTNQLAAPGQDIYSDWNGTLDSGNGSDLLHNTISGTSMATPFVSGVVALMQNAAKYFGGRYLSDPNQILQILQQTADTIIDSNNPNNSRYDSSSGQTSNLPETGLTFKRINALNAVQAVQQLVTGGSITIGPAPGPDTDNTTASATSVSEIDGTTISTFDGNISNDGLVQVGPPDVDLYKLDVISPGSVTFALSLPGGGTAFAAALRLFDSTGNVIDQNNGTAGSYPTLTTPNALAIGTYYLGISGVGNENYKIDGTGATAASSLGDYAVQIQLFNPDPNGTIQGAVSVDLTEPTETLQDSLTGAETTDVLESGILGSDPPPIGSNTRITVKSDVDMFQVTAPDDGNLILAVDSNVFDQTYIKVFDSNQAVLGTADSNASTTIGENLLSVKVTSGDTYYVAVTVPDNAGFNPTDPFKGRQSDATPGQDYDLHLRFDNGDTNGTALAPTVANIGTPLNGRIGSDGILTIGASGTKDVDWMTFTASQAGLFNITAQSTTNGFTPDLTLWTYTQGQTNIVKVADTASSSLFASPASLFAPAAVTPPGGAGSAQLIYQVSAGQTFFSAISGRGNGSFNWYAIASGTGGQTGNYTLSTQLQPLSSLATLSNNAIRAATPTTIAVGQTINGNIGADGPLVIGPTDVDMFKLIAGATETLDIRTGTTQEGSADTVLRVFDANGNALAANDNIDATTTASDLKVSVQQGQTYYIGVDGAGVNELAYNPLTGANAGSGSTGNYSLTLTATAPGISVNTPPAVPAYPGGSITFTVTLDQALGVPVTVDYATADATAVAGTDYTPKSGTLTFPPGTTTQAVSVPVLVNPNPTAAHRSFTLALSNPGGAQISTATATATIVDAPVTTLTFTAGSPKTYTNSLGKSVRLTLNGPGTGTAVFISGTADPSQITLNNTTVTSTFVVRSAGTPLGTIVVNGSLQALIAKTATLTGNLTVSGSLSRLMLANASGGATGGTISMGAAGAPMLVNLGFVSNETLSTPGAIASLKANDWLSSGGGVVQISAASIGSLTTRGDFAASVTTQNLGPVKIGGSLTAGTWTIAGGGQNFQVTGQASAAWTAVFGGALHNVRFGNVSGLLTAGSIDKLKADSLSNATLTLTGAGVTLGAMSVGQTVSNSTIISTGSLGKVAVGAFLDSKLLAGVSTSVTGLPSTAADFTANDSILSFTVRGDGRPFSFSNSNIAAASIGKVILARVKTNNGGTPFGVATKGLGAYTNRGVLKWTNKESTTLLAADGDLVVRIITT